MPVRSNLRLQNLQLRPGAVLLRRFHAGFDEGDPFDAVLDGRIDDVLSRLAALPPRRADRPRRLLVDVGETFEVAFRMARRHAGQPRRDLAGAGAGAGDELLRLPERRVPEIVRVGLDPFDAALGAVDPELQPVLVARRDLA